MCQVERREKRRVSKTSPIRIRHFMAWRFTKPRRYYNSCCKENYPFGLKQHLFNFVL